MTYLPNPVPTADSGDNNLMRDVVGNKSDTTGGTSLVSKILAVGGGGAGHIPLFTGNIYYVDAAQSDDTGDGTTPETAKKTITAAEALVSVGDAITIRAGTYTESVTVNVVGTELWGEIGATIVGTLTVSANSCRVENIDIQPSGAVGIIVSGSSCIIENIRISGTPTTAFNITGSGNTLERCNAINYTLTGYDISDGMNHLHDCTGHGDDGARRGFYLSHSDADGCYLDNCTSIGNGTSSYHIITGITGVLLKSCTSGIGDGRWIDADEASEFTDFHFKCLLHNSLDITQVGGGTWEYNIFKVTGVVKIKGIFGVVETTLTGSNTACYLQVFSANGTAVITKATGVAIGAALQGAFMGRIDNDGTAMFFADATAPIMADETNSISEGFRLGEDRTGGAHVATYIRFIHTTAGASSGDIDWHVDFEPISIDGWVEAV